MGRNARRRHPTVVPKKLNITRKQHPIYGWNRPRMANTQPIMTIEQLKARFMPAPREVDEVAEEPVSENLHP